MKIERGTIIFLICPQDKTCWHIHNTVEKEGIIQSTLTEYKYMCYITAIKDTGSTDIFNLKLNEAKLIKLFVIILLLSLARQLNLNMSVLPLEIKRRQFPV